MRASAPKRTAPRAKPILVLGTDDVASAVGHALAGAGILVLLMRDQKVPVLRRGMSFDDALEYGSVRLDGLTAYAELGAPDPLADATSIAVTGRGIEELLDPADIVGVIDARMRQRIAPLNPRRRGPFLIGVGSGFTAGENADVVIDITRSRIKRRIGLAPRPGVWWTFREIGEPVEAGAIVGLSGGMQVAAPQAGSLSGLVRRGTDVPTGSALVEVDPRGSASHCFGITPENVAVGNACIKALRQHLMSQPATGSEAVR